MITDPNYLEHLNFDETLNDKREFLGLKISRHIMKRIEKEAKLRNITKAHLIRLLLHRVFK